MASYDANKGAKHGRLARQEYGPPLDQPIGCIVEAVEGRAGLSVFVLEMPLGVSGAYKPDAQAIFVNRSQAVVRQRFTVAHEFGHHRLSHQDLKVIDTVDDMAGRNAHDPREVQANAFAAEFLAPKQAVVAWWGADGSRVPDLEAVCRLANAFGISAIAALYRLSTTRIIEGQALLDRLKGEIDEELHVEVVERLELDPFQDELQSAQDADRIRLPERLRGGALEAVLSGALTIADAARRAGRESAELEAALAALRI